MPRKICKARSPPTGGKIPKRQAEELTAKVSQDFEAFYKIRAGQGAEEHWVRLSGVVTELYDVVALPGVVRPMALGFRNDEVQRMISVGSWATVGEEKTQSALND